MENKLLPESQCCGDESLQRRRNLVVVRAGKNSLHPRWLDAGGQRTWDLVVSIYDPDAIFDHGPEALVVYQRGGKWNGLYSYLSRPGVLSGYDYVWLPDDDIDARSEQIDQIFTMMRRYALDVAQPALTRSSYYSHFAMLACPGYVLRYVNFVEIMAPCLTMNLLSAVLSDFQRTSSGFGLDYIWCRISDAPLYKAAIIDTVAVRHTRPIGSALRRHMRRDGLVAEEEELSLRSRYRVHGRIRPLVYAAIEADGGMRKGCKILGLTMALRYLRVCRDFTAQEGAIGKILQMLRRQWTRRPDLSRLTRKPLADAGAGADQIMW